MPPDYALVASTAATHRLAYGMVTQVEDDATSDPEKPFVRVKEDERDPETYFDVPKIEKLVDRMIDCRNRVYGFFCETFPEYAELPAKLYDSKRPGS
jgi:hypothetical protein